MAINYNARAPPGAAISVEAIVGMEIYSSGNLCQPGELIIVAWPLLVRGRNYRPSHRSG